MSKYNYFFTTYTIPDKHSIASPTAKFQQLAKNLITIFKALDYSYVIELTKQGTPHLHIALYITPMGQSTAQKKIKAQYDQVFTNSKTWYKKNVTIKTEWYQSPYEQSRTLGYIHKEHPQNKTIVSSQSQESIQTGISLYQKIQADSLAQKQAKSAEQKWKLYYKSQIEYLESAISEAQITPDQLILIISEYQHLNPPPSYDIKSLRVIFWKTHEHFRYKKKFIHTQYIGELYKLLIGLRV